MSVFSFSPFEVARENSLLEKKISTIFSKFI